MLRSAFDPANDQISLELTAGDQTIAGGWRLALTSIVQLMPASDASLSLISQLATYHEFAPTAATELGPGTAWSVNGLATGHRPAHANDGPVSAYLVLPDGTTIDVDVEPMGRLGPTDDARPHNASDRPRRAASSEPRLVPYPRHVDIADETPRPDATLRLGDRPEIAASAWRAIVDLERRTAGRATLTESAATESASTRLTASLGDSSEFVDGEYRIELRHGRIEVTARDQAGFRHAFITLARWLPTGVPTIATVRDHPVYDWRGLHIDLARQWYEPGDVERLIDVAAWRKLSHLHLHLTDDEAWRVPVDTWPDLAADAATRGHGLPLPPMLGGRSAPTGRVYTIDEIASWVCRADELGVTLVPEIDLPGHMHAALTALPRLRDPGDRSAARSVQHFVDNALVPGHPENHGFLEDVVDTVAALFPSSPYIHVGGDEVADGAWSAAPFAQRLASDLGVTTTRELEAAFHRELVAIVRDRAGRRVGAWQEAAESGGVQPHDGYVIGWRTVDDNRSLAAAGYDVVVSPGQAYYLDMALDNHWESPGGSWAGSTTLADVCAFDPVAGWSDQERSHVLGVQACLWSEHVHDRDVLDHLLFPRLDAIAERAWTGEVHGGPESLRHRAQNPNA